MTTVVLFVLLIGFLLASSQGPEASALLSYFSSSEDNNPSAKTQGRGAKQMLQNNKNHNTT